jgi:hypothetical protein
MNPKPRRIEDPRLPEFAWDQPYTREDARRYLRQLLTAMGYERGRGKLRPTLDELIESVAVAVRQVNRIGWSPDRQTAATVLVRMVLSDFNQVEKIHKKSPE